MSLNLINEFANKFMNNGFENIKKPNIKVSREKVKKV